MQSRIPAWLHPLVSVCFCDLFEKSFLKDPNMFSSGRCERSQLQLCMPAWLRAPVSNCNKQLSPTPTTRTDASPVLLLVSRLLLSIKVFCRRSSVLLPSCLTQEAPCRLCPIPQCLMYKVIIHPNGRALLKSNSPESIEAKNKPRSFL